jgi:putrescine transport system substrate-binding protein
MSILRGNGCFTAALCAMAVSVIGCSGPDTSDNTSRVAAKSQDNNVVNLYIWADYLPPETVASFEKVTGIKVRVSNFDTNETLESRILTGNSGFDVVVPTAPFLQRQIRSGAYLPLDKAKLPSLANLDSGMMSRVALNDPGNAHAVIYAWGTYGIGYNEKMVNEVLPGSPINSWRVIFDPVYASKLAKCGISTLDAPAGVVRLVLKYLGRKPNTPSSQDLLDAEAVLLSIRPYIRLIDSSIDTQAIANGDICVAIGYNGDFVQARQRVREAKSDIIVRYVIPNEGSLLWFDMLAIPRDAPHPNNAHRLIEYLLNPQVMANITSTVGSANANTFSLKLLDTAIASDPMIFPTPEQQQRLFVQSEDSPEQSRAITRIWQRFKTGQ